MVKRGLLIGLCLALAALLSWLVLTGPAPRAADAPDTAFSAQRAMIDVEAIAQRPHPVGSTEGDAVRDYLFVRMRDLGLETRARLAVQSGPDGSRLGLENLIGVLPGRDRTAPALALMAHYDSTPTGPGAADDAAGVAAVLEIVRALNAQGQPARDVIVVLTDGEEAGLLGARAFFDGDSTAGRLGFVINLEARGSRGRAMMFETGRRNGETIGLFARGSRRPLSNSLMVFVYEKMPNGTDFTLAKDHGLQGLNFAFLGGARDYHAASDTPANLDQRSLQDIGAQGLAAARRVANGGLPAAAPDLAYSDVLGLGIIAYPPAAGWAVWGLSAVALGAGWLRARRRGEARIRDAALGLGLSLGMLAATGGVLFALGGLFDALRVSPVTHMAAIEALSLGIAGAGALGAALLGRRLGAGGWTGVLKAGLWAGLAVQLLAPLAAPVIQWPLLLACVVAGVTGLRVGRARARAACAVAAILGLAFVGVLTHQGFVTLFLPPVFAVWGWLCLPLIWPLARSGTH